MPARRNKATKPKIKFRIINAIYSQHIKSCLKNTVQQQLHKGTTSVCRKEGMKMQKSLEGIFSFWVNAKGSFSAQREYKYQLRGNTQRNLPAKRLLIFSSAHINTQTNAAQNLFSGAQRPFLLSRLGDVVRGRTKTAEELYFAEERSVNGAGVEERGWNDPDGHQSHYAAFALRCDLKLRLCQLPQLVR